MHKFIIIKPIDFYINKFIDLTFKVEEIMSEFEEKVLDLLGKMNEKLDNVLDAVKGGAPAAAVPSTEVTEAGTPKPSELVDKQKQEELEAERPPVEGRRVCPACGSTEFRTEEDKSKVLYQQGGMKIYQKKYICKKCGEITF